MALVAAIFTALALAGPRAPNIDDAFIVLVYARHLVEHGSIYWNAADGSVDGYTSVLDMLLRAALLALTGADPILTAHVLAMLGTAGCVAVSSWIARHDAPQTLGGQSLAALGALACACNLTLAAAAGYLLAMQLYALLAVAALGATLYVRADSRGARVELAALCILLGLVRPEGVPLAILLLVVFTTTRAQHIEWIARIAPLAAFLAALGAYAVWHLFAFGALAPNTFYAKASDSRWRELLDGVHYVRAFATADDLQGALVLLLFAAPAAAFSRGWVSAERRRAFVLASGVAIVAVVEVVLEGGDCYDGGRFLATPIALLLVAVVIAAGGLRGARALVPATVLVLIVAAASARIASDAHERIRRIVAGPYRASLFTCEANLSRFLASHAKTVAVTDFQRLKYFADGLEVVDLSGLNDRRRAHLPHPGQNLWGKGDIEAAPASEAEVLVIGTRWYHAVPMARYPTRAVVQAPLSAWFLGESLSPETRAELSRRYLPASIPPAPCGHFVNVFLRADRAAQFTESGILVGRAD